MASKLGWLVWRNENGSEVCSGLMRIEVPFGARPDLIARSSIRQDAGWPAKVLEATVWINAPSHTRPSKTALEEEHADIEAALEALHFLPNPDSAVIARFKRRKLQIKDQIANLFPIPSSEE